MKMIWLALAVLLTGCSSTGSANTGSALQKAIEQSAEETMNTLPLNSRVLVVSFDSENENLSDYLMDELSGELFDRGVGLVDRRNLKYVLRELMFQQTDYVDEKSAFDVGKFLEADMNITGEFADMDSVYRYRTSVTDVKTRDPAGDTRLDVPADRETRRMITALANAKTVTREYVYYEVQTAQTFLDRAISHAERGEFDQAVMNVGEAIRLKPDMYAAYVCRGAWLYVFKKDYANALADINHAIELDPDFWVAYMHRGNLHLMQKDYDRAIEDNTKAIELAPDNAWAYLFRANVFMADWDFGSAIDDLETALELEPDNIKVKQMLKLAERYY